MLDLRPDDADAWCYKGAALVRLRLYLKALDAFEQALQFNPELSEARLGKEKALQC